MHEGAVMRWPFVVTAVLASGACCMAPQDDRKEAAQSVEYFGGFTGYDLPIRLQHRITKAEAEKLRSYYVAEYDRAGRVAVVRKIVDGRIAFRHEYTYDAEGVLVEARISNDEGGTSVLRRSSDGRMIKEQ
jgi:hypothetical protein